MMKQPTFTLTDAETFRNAVFHSKDLLIKQVALREKYAGCVVKIDSGWREARFSDYSEWYAYQDVTVWDTESGTSKTINALVLKDEVTLWQVDATPEVIEAYNTHVREVLAPASTNQWSQERVLNLRRNYDQRIEKFVRSFDRGSTWEIVRGRKFPIGTRGKVFWSGLNRWGLVVGLSTTDRKDERGRNLDVIFVSAANLERVLSSDEQAKVDQMNQECAAFQAEYSVGGHRYQEHLAICTNNLIAEMELVA